MAMVMMMVVMMMMVMVVMMMMLRLMVVMVMMMMVMAVMLRLMLMAMVMVMMVMVMLTAMLTTMLTMMLTVAPWFPQVLNIPHRLELTWTSSQPCLCRMTMVQWLHPPSRSLREEFSQCRYEKKCERCREGWCCRRGMAC